jgi:hypothetical protein
MERRVFGLVTLDEGGERMSRDNQNLRLVCCMEGGGKVVIWGESGSQQNINTVKAAGLPCKVECDCIAPEQWAARYGHSFWVPQGTYLRVLPRQPNASKVGH